MSFLSTFTNIIFLGGRITEVIYFDMTEMEGSTRKSNEVLGNNWGNSENLIMYRKVANCSHIQLNNCLLRFLNMFRWLRACFLQFNSFSLSFSFSHILHSKFYHVRMFIFGSCFPHIHFALVHKITGFESKQLILISIVPYISIPVVDFHVAFLTALQYTVEFRWTLSVVPFHAANAWTLQPNSCISMLSLCCWSAYSHSTSLLPHELTLNIETSTKHRDENYKSEWWNEAIRYIMMSVDDGVWRQPNCLKMNWFFFLDKFSFILWRSCEICLRILQIHWHNWLATLYTWKLSTSVNFVWNYLRPIDMQRTRSTKIHVHDW